MPIRKYYQLNREHCKEYNRNYLREYRKMHFQSDKKQRARANLRHAIIKGIVIKKHCEKCGLKAEAHHPNYDKPFDVNWLCKIHHEEHHKQLI